MGWTPELISGPSANGKHRLTDDSREECRSEDEHEGDDHHEGSRLVLTSGLFDKPSESPFHGPQHNNRPPDCGEEDVYCGGACLSAHEGQGESEEDPADNVVADTSSEDDGSHAVVEQFGGGEDTT